MVMVDFLWDFRYNEKRSSFEGIPMKYKTRFLFFFAAMILFNLAANFAHPVTPTIIKDLALPD